MVGSVMGSILASWFPQLDGVSLRIVDSCETAVGIVLRIELHFDAGLGYPTSGCTVKRRSTPAVRMPFSVKAGRGGRCSFRRRPDHAP
jgi:hypothetical protein